MFSRRTVSACLILLCTFIGLVSGLPQFSNTTDDKPTSDPPKKGRRKRTAVDTVLDFGLSSLIDAAMSISDDRERREGFTKNLTATLANEIKDSNIVVCHSKNDPMFDGELDDDWTHNQTELKISLNRKIKFDIYVFDSGTFIRKGDGGFQNWGYYGNVSEGTTAGGNLVFVERKKRKGLQVELTDVNRAIRGHTQSSLTLVVAFSLTVLVVVLQM